MDEPKLELIDISGLVNKINSALAESEGPISFGKFAHKEPKKNPFLYRARDRELDTRGKYPLDQCGILDFELKTNLGYVFVETGFTEASSDYGGRYETLRLRIKRPIELSNGNVLPNCSVKVLIETGEFGKSFVDRKYHVRVAHLAWVEKDLSQILPIEWFLSRSVNDYELRPQQSR